MNLTRLFTLLVAAASTGCVTTYYTKTVEVSKDGSGRVVGTKTIETAQQRGTGWPIKFSHLKGVHPDEARGCPRRC